MKFIALLLGEMEADSHRKLPRIKVKTGDFLVCDVPENLKIVSLATSDDYFWFAVAIEITRLNVLHGNL